MTLIPAILSLAPNALAGPGEYTEEQAREEAPIVVSGTAVEVTCQGWIEGSSLDQYQARYDATIVIDEAVKGDFAAGEEITIRFMEAVGYEDDSECGWNDALIEEGLVAEFYLYQMSGEMLRQLDFTVPSIIDDDNILDLPDCAPTEETTITDEELEICADTCQDSSGGPPVNDCLVLEGAAECVYTCEVDTDCEAPFYSGCTDISDDGTSICAIVPSGDEEEEEDETDDDNSESPDDQADPSSDGDQAAEDDSAKRGCQTALTPAGATGFLPMLLAIAGFRRRD